MPLRRRPNATEVAINRLIELQQQQKPDPVPVTVENNSLYSYKNLNALAIAAVIGVAAFLWNGVTSQPVKSGEQFALIQTQNAETRSTLIEVKTAVGGLNQKLDALQRDNAETRSGVDKNTAEIDGLKKQVTANSDRITQMERDTR